MRWFAALALATVLGGTQAGFAAAGERAASPASAAAPVKPADWVGGDPAHLAADKAACKQESAAVDPNVISGYSDPRYGMTAAMAAAVARQNPLSDNSREARAAAFAACMGDKGWQEP